ncbi:class I SAM-dependent methyltransferase [Roseovarius sp. SK2]|uniref:class I SAM-dependent methyltransferase n=1 Tax=Roseovarius TaxID=74030 RepID=UPI00237B6525|nr:class I SAM-dependent methyltransferase [Roseovarius sp. SK2]MDD9727777.1 class I SAM-dependent methyltransferase [Roseovarius sp. SK2]
MAQNIFDNPEFFTGYSQLPRQVQALDGAPEWNAILAMLPDVAGKRVADLGCSFGWASRWFRKNGVISVLGLDLSENMTGPNRRDARVGRRGGTANDVDGFGIKDLISLPSGPTGQAACCRMS